MSFPEHLRYTKDHEWILANGSIATIGITDFAQRELGDIVFVEFEPLDSELDQDDAFGTVEAVKTVSELFMPVKGKIIEHNEELEDSPELINESPYEKGWMIKIEMTDPEDIEGLFTSVDYTTMVGS